MTGRYRAKIPKFDIVAAIDIGTSSSGYAYSSVSEFKRSPLNIISEKCWNKSGFSKDVTERKTASCILFDKNEKFVSFGYDAQHEFAQLQSKKKEGKFAFFQQFKMDLYEQKAGLPPTQVLIALEPEAASVFCNCLKTNRPENITEGFVEPTAGTKYIVVDLGGGTTDITVHEKLENGMLREIRKSSGNGTGGSTVDKAFIEMIHKKLTTPVCLLLKKENPVAYMDLRKDLEEAKKSVTTVESDILEIPINYRVINSISKAYFRSSISNNISDEIVDDNLQVQGATVQELFKHTTEEVLRAVDNALQFDGADEVSMIILVGGFANCEIIELATRNRFEPRRVIVPSDASSAVLHGAVLYGHNPHIICNRIMKCTYGVGVQLPFQDGIHDPSRQFVQSGKAFCGKLFDIIVKRDQSVPSGTFISRDYVIIPKANQHKSIIYISESLKPKYTDEENCQEIGALVVDIPNTKDERRTIDVHFFFGGTQLTVQAADRDSGLEFETTVFVD